jgi:hypothetical protein
LERRSHRGDCFARGVAEGSVEQPGKLFEGRIELSHKHNNQHCAGFNNEHVFLFLNMLQFHYNLINLEM